MAKKKAKFEFYADYFVIEMEKSRMKKMKKWIEENIVAIIIVITFIPIFILTQRLFFPIK